MMIQVLFNILIYYSFGGKSLSYLVLGTYFGTAIHPMCAHFLAEHIMFSKVPCCADNEFIINCVKGIETYSYYGMLNVLSYNVGYHNEHHDFPNIKSSLFPLIRQIAPEFYEEIPQVILAQLDVTF